MRQTRCVLVIAMVCSFTFSHTSSYVIPGDFVYDNRPDSQLDKRNSWWSKRSYDSNGNTLPDRSHPSSLDQFQQDGRPATYNKRNSFWTKKSVDLAMDNGVKSLKDNNISQDYGIDRYKGCAEKCAAISDHCYHDYGQRQSESLLCHVAKQLCYEWCPTGH